DDRDLVGNLFEALRERGTLLRRRIGFVEGVEDEHARKRQRREEIAEEGPDEARKVLLRLGRELRQRRGGLAGKLLRSHAQVVQERCAVRIAAVVLVPKVAAVAR